MFSYVLNVIENPAERQEALAKAWALAKKRLVVAAVVRGATTVDNGRITKIGTFAKDWKLIELKGFIESTLGYEAIGLDKDKFVVYRDGRQFSPMHYDEVLEKSQAIASSGWVAPFYTIIKRYHTNLKYRPERRSGGRRFKQWMDENCHYRLVCRYPWLTGKQGQQVKTVHIKGGLESEHMQWAMEGLRRRNRIAEMKFHCVEQKFLEEFYGFRSFEFFDTENVKIYS